MQFIQGQSRHQTYFATLEDQVAADNALRFIDAFIDKLDFQQSGCVSAGFSQRNIFNL